KVPDRGVFPSLAEIESRRQTLALRRGLQQNFGYLLCQSVARSLPRETERESDQAHCPGRPARRKIVQHTGKSCCHTRLALEHDVFNDGPILGKPTLFLVALKSCTKQVELGHDVAQTGRE